MRIVHQNENDSLGDGYYKYCIQHHFLDEIMLTYYSSGNIYTGKLAIALFTIREKTPSEKAAWESRVRKLTEQHLTNQ